MACGHDKGKRYQESQAFHGSTFVVGNCGRWGPRHRLDVFIIVALSNRLKVLDTLFVAKSTFDNPAHDASPNRQRQHVGQDRDDAMAKADQAVHGIHRPAGRQRLLQILHPSRRNFDRPPATTQRGQHEADEYPQTDDLGLGMSRLNSRV